MSPEKIIEMAKQCGVLAGYEGEPSLLVIFAQGIMDIEREACAKIVDEFCYGSTKILVEKAIRARGQA
jgi:hypothetical protein